MENNTNYQNQYNQAPYQQYVHPYYQQIDPNYDAISKDFLTQAIVSCAISSLPIGSIIAIFMASKNRKALLEYLDRGGIHTIKIKVSSALSRAGKYSGIACTVFWGIYMLYIAFVIFILILAAITGAMHR